MFKVRIAAVAAAASATLAAVPTAHAAPRTFETGFLEQTELAGNNRDAWLDRARSVGVARVRLAFTWDSVAPTQPPADQAGSAAWGGYRFDSLDAQVRSAVAKGVLPMLSVHRAPAWATEPGRPSRVAVGAWKPNAAALGTFMRAVAERYSGRFPDPAVPGAVLPKVAQYQIWNEPNLNVHLAPQAESGKPFSPGRFRDMVNASYTTIKSVTPDATVVAGGLAPYGDPGANPSRTRPLLFLRRMLCVDDQGRKSCDERTQADVMAMHPYTRNRPSQSAVDADDVAITNVNRVQSLIDAARGAGTIGPGRPPLWVTELHWETSPDPKGISPGTRARYMSEAFWRLWRADVPAVYWYLLRDEEYQAGEQYYDSYQSGVFYRSGRRKSDARAFRFPLLVTGTGRLYMNVWFRTPTKGTATVQVLRRGRWVSVKKVRGLPLDGVSRVKIRKAGVRAVRAKAGKATSYAWTTG